MPPAESDLRTIVMSESTEVVTHICEPGTRRENKVFWSSPSEPGIQHCTVTVEVCAADGRSWTADEAPEN